MKAMLLLVITNSKRNKNSKSSESSYDEVLLEILMVKDADYIGVTFDESLSLIVISKTS